MTWAWSLPLLTLPQTWNQALRVPRVRMRLTRAIVPTHRDWGDAHETIDGLLACRPRPAEIVVVDDNTERNPPRWTRRRGITLVEYDANRGPSYARNAGALHHTGTPVEWLYFTDTGCARDPEFFAVLQDAMMRAPRSTVACAGPVHGVIKSPTDSRINHYMTIEGILNPPMDASGPQAIVTANALVHAGSFAACGGFDCSYPFAAGEDLDLGVRLRSLGPIAWASEAVVYHCFKECESDFRSRFERYGRGSAHLEHRLLLPSIRPSKMTARDPALQRLADVQVSAMIQGYDWHKNILNGV